MRKFFDNATLMALLAGVLVQVAMANTNYLLVWFSFIPLFIVLQKPLPAKQLFKTGILFGAAISAISFYWMIPGAVRFTGSSAVYGVGVALVSALIMSSFFGLLILLLGILKKQSQNLVGNALLAACLFAVGEALWMGVSKHLPWFGYHSGMALAGNLYTIQPAQYFGIHILTFVVILVNYLFAILIEKRQWTKLLMPAGFIMVYWVIGLYLNSQYIFHKTKAVKVALLAGNIPPETRWNDNTGNALAGLLLDMNRTAADMPVKPQIALWSESAIPWTYREDDDLVNEALKVTREAGTTHIIGFNSEATENSVYNSVYGLQPNGKVLGRYDKQVLLSFIEEPLIGILFPFLSGGGFEVQPGNNDQPLNTPYGKAGIIVCNEATVPNLTTNMVNNGAQFMLNLSNDGWFSNSYLVNLHFYNARLRAVESRKDIAINSNYGYCGLVKASGEIAMQKKSQSAFVEEVFVQPNTIKTLYTSSPWLFVYLCAAGIIVLGFINYRKLAVS